VGTRDTTEADVIVIGGGIAGLGAALRLKDRGLDPLVLEADSRVGGRMTTDRANGFVIDRGVTLLGKGFKRMRAMVKRLGLSPLACSSNFSVAIEGPTGPRGYRGVHFEDLLLDPGLSWRDRLAALRFGLDLVWHSRALAHGRSDLSGPLDDEDSFTYFQRIGAAEVFRRVFEPGLNGPVGGAAAASSRVIAMQTIWNLLVRGQWNLSDGVDRIPESIGAQVRVVTNARVISVERHANEVQVEVQINSARQTLHARGVVFALPGHLVPGLCPSLPEEIRELLARTHYSKMVNAAVALSSPPASPHAGYAFRQEVVSGAAIELEHLRVPHRCPQGAGMAGVYLWDTPQLRRLDGDDEAIKKQASEIVERTFPECRGKVLFVHLVKWNIAIAQFPPGRLREMTALRNRLAAWNAPFDLCGDYLDGISSEGALRTGEQAGDRLANKLVKP
jgi:oxygen-dependent protoporphyrinogen oxidase